MNDSKMSTSLPLAFRGDTPVSIQVQSILYNNRASDVKRALQSLARSAELAMRAGVCRQVLVRYGDSSQMPCFRDDEVAELQREFGSTILIEYVHFGANLGSAGGHNRLAKDSTSDFFLIQNPDVVVCPRIFQLLLEPFANRGVGLVEAKQLPIEHPKEYNVSTGETSWAATACALVPRSLYEQIGGFDSASFFLYCDDVDFSWSIRLAGYQVIYQPAAVVFHDKRLTADGKWQPTTSELYFSAEAALILAYKWSRADLADKILEYFDVAPEPHYSRAAAEYRKRLVDGKLPKPVDSENKIAQFIDGNYATHRYAL